MMLVIEDTSHNEWVWRSNYSSTTSHADVSDGTDMSRASVHSRMNEEITSEQIYHHH